MNASSQRGVRFALGFACAALTALLGAFTWIMMNGASNPMADMLLTCLLLVGGLVIVSQLTYFLVGNVFEEDGKLATSEILFAVICFQCIVQFAFGFAIYAVDQSAMQNDSYDAAYAHFVSLQQQTDGNYVENYASLDLEEGMPVYIERVNVATLNEAATATADQYFRFPLRDGKVLMKKSQVYVNQKLSQFALSMLASLIISVFLMIELVYLVVKFIDSKSQKAALKPTGYLRQLAFLFYLGAYLGNSFIPILARELASGLVGVDGNFVAGLPYSTEALANCAAILIATRVFERKGWKPPYILGICIYVIGAVSSALAPNIQLFILSRGIAGLGYGFCWMTLRNITTLEGNRAANFSGLTSGIYAGLMCGVAFGAVLADRLGYRTVLLLSAGLCAILSSFSLFMTNQKGKPRQVQTGDGQRVSVGSIVGFVALMALIVIPTCISEAFCGYVSPLYINTLKLPTAYVGYVSLVYNMSIVYISSTFLIKLVWRIKNAVIQNLLHMLLTAAALIACSQIGGMPAMAISALILGSADGFGFSVQNAYVLDTQVSRRLGSTRMLTYLSLFKKFGATLGPMVFSLFLRDGIGGLGFMGILFAISGLAFAVIVAGLQKRGHVIAG